MNIKEAYNAWSSQYDTNENKTRDLEARALREVLAPLSFENCLEIGSGTGKNTAWLIEKANHITAVDLSEEMMAKAKAKFPPGKIDFIQADITKEWTFASRLYDLVSFSLVLEHIPDLDPVFQKAAAVLQSGGYMYTGELHPFKQYSGSKARFNTAEGEQVVDCFTHHFTDFIIPAQKNGLALIDVREYFDNDNREDMPRILTLLFRKA